MSLKTKLSEVYTILRQNEDVPEWASSDPDVRVEIEDSISDAIDSLRIAIKLIES